MRFWKFLGREHLQNPDVNRSHEPTPNPSGGGEQCRARLPSSPPGRGQGWVGSWKRENLQNPDANRGHESVATVLHKTLLLVKQSFVVPLLSRTHRTHCREASAPSLARGFWRRAGGFHSLPPATQAPGNKKPG